VFRVKICGITNPLDAAAAAAAGADAIGLNFYEGSRRFVSEEEAARIVAAIPAGVVKVGVFVNHTREAVLRGFDALRLDLVQLHGDEPPEFLAALGGLPVMRAFRRGPGGAAEVAAYLDRCRALGCLPRMVLVDAHRPGAYGGTGELGDWNAAAELARSSAVPSVVLAGGLTPGNVAKAVAATRPRAVDTASGVEASPGVKDPELVRAFVAAARGALDAANQQGA
jgi:phosphoribosylanthranilate isomerase